MKKTTQSSSDHAATNQLKQGQHKKQWANYIHYCSQLREWQDMQQSSIMYKTKIQYPTGLRTT